MLQLLSLTVLLVVFGQLTYAQVPFPGHCPQLAGLSQFDLNAYTGIWYEQSKYPFIFEIGKKCPYARYENSGNNTISVMNAAINRFTGTPSNTTGYAKVLGPGKLAVVFSSRQSATKPNYIVLGTDYSSWALVYSCTDYAGIFNTKNVWILSRDRKASEAAVAAAKKVMDENKLSQAFLIESLQDDCPVVDDPKGVESASNQNVISKV